MKPNELISLSKCHENLCKKVSWYSLWHKNQYHKHIHLATFYIFILVLGIIAYNSHFFKPNFVQADNDKKEDTDKIKNSAKEKNEEKDKSKEDKKEKKGEENENQEKDKIKITETLETEIISEEKTLEEEKAEEITPIDESLIEKLSKIEFNPEDVGDVLKNINEKIDEEIKKDNNENEQKENKEEIIEEKPEIITDPVLENVITEEIPTEIIEIAPTDIPVSTEETPVEDPLETTPPQEEELPKVEEIIPIIEEPLIPLVEPIQGTATVIDVTSPVRNNKYRTGPMTIHVVFNKKVEVTGTPSLLIATGDPSETEAYYKSGSGSDILIFVYNINPSNFSSDLDYLSTDSLSLNDGNIKDMDGNNASIVLPMPGSSNSLSGNKDIIIDTKLRTLNNVL
ncbi:MAG: hypothetical protein WA101_03635 [Minisyncoccia bacterium]